MPNLKTLSASEVLTHTTTRIVGDLDSNKKSIGTGFFFNFQIKDQHIPVIITNKHVIEDCKKIRFTINEADENDNRLNEKHLNGFLEQDDIEKFIVYHPKNDVDLCAIPIGGNLNNAVTLGKKPYLKYINSNLIPTSNEWDSLTAIEDITMVGYPDGIWDEKNNLPVTRRGTTATHPRIDYNGNSEFLIDTSVFTGSSGSPVYLFNQGSYATDKGITMGSRMKLLGINYAVYTQTAQGNITIKKTPTSVKPVTETKIPINLGVIIKSTKILDFEPLIQKLLINQ